MKNKLEGSSWEKIYIAEKESKGKNEHKAI